MSETIQILQDVIEDRKQHPKKGSYTCALLEAGDQEMLKKIGEEATEVVVAGALESDERLVYETADLFYHLLVMLAARDLCWEDVETELRSRFQ